MNIGNVIPVYGLLPPKTAAPACSLPHLKGFRAVTSWPRSCFNWRNGLMPVLYTLLYRRCWLFVRFLIDFFFAFFFFLPFFCPIRRNKHHIIYHLPQLTLTTNRCMCVAFWSSLKAVLVEATLLWRSTYGPSSLFEFQGEPYAEFQSIEKQVVVLRRVLVDQPLVSGYVVRKDVLIINGIPASSLSMMYILLQLAAESHFCWWSDLLQNDGTTATSIDTSAGSQERGPSSSYVLLWRDSHVHRQVYPSWRKLPWQRWRVHSRFCSVFRNQITRSCTPLRGPSRFWC